MPISEDDQRRLREEEIFRTEVRRSLEAARSPSGLRARASRFLESKFGFWLLTTVFVALWTTVYTGVSNWINRERIEESRRAESKRQEFDLVVKVVPMLTSDKAADRQIGLSLLEGLASARTIEPVTASQITATLQSIVNVGAAPSATPEEQRLAGEVARLVDPPPAAATSLALPTPAPASAPAIGAVTLPPRVYIQIGDEAQRDAARKATDLLRRAGILAPGIELVRSVPRRNELRYCSEKSRNVVPGDVLRVLKPVLDDVTAVQLQESQCRNVRSNHFELWLAKIPS